MIRDFNGKEASRKDFGIIFMPIVGIGEGERRKTGALQWMKGHY
jgi:hypothetical protein